ncbi:HupE/UreJ family protein [Deinococcus sp. YIM 134068]|uniref:HupE/UreJ family protein n=1 Tax=Deinococcus lichenicola TaxID=3118910 RepID=UPI002F944F18
MTLPRIPLLPWLLALVLALLGRAGAHPMPTTLVQLNIHGGYVDADLDLPFNELQLATRWNLVGNANALAQYGERVRAYLREHLTVTTPGGQPWTVSVGEPEVSEAEQTATGPFQEFIVPVRLTPPAGASSRAFTVKYDAIVHQVVTHNVLVSIRQDWEGGVAPEHPLELGVIRTDTRTGTVPPLVVEREGGGLWGGFVGLLRLGMTHIAEGTDHLLFLLVLLLPAPLLARTALKPPRWGEFGGARRSLVNILKIVTAFTIGHSLTLLLGTFRLVELPTQPIEALIAFSILVSAVHALRPIFPGREAGVAAGFGLIHGLAFSFTLAEFDLTAGQMAVSLLGFNIGIELMQLLVIAVTMPWLILLARTSVYTPVRVVGAGVAALAALGWLGQRLLGTDNPLSLLADGLGTHAMWIIGGLAVLAVLATLVSRQGPGVGRPLP